MFKAFTKGHGIGNRLLPPIRQTAPFRKYGSSFQVSPKRKIWPWVTGISTITVGGIGFYLYKSSSLQVLEYAKQYAKTKVEDVTWRETIAAALLDICSQEQGREMILRHHWGSTLASWIVEESTY